ncbi:MAG: hypothetical protein JWM12_1501, partial [Ilumatobacteraceae bacterium]|nr:hypothetical protein [Ilumatobacteraceae bacterium]
MLSAAYTPMFSAWTRTTSANSSLSRIDRGDSGRFLATQYVFGAILQPCPVSVDARDYPRVDFPSAVRFGRVNIAFLVNSGTLWHRLLSQ